MSQLEYLVALLSIIVGLGLTNIAWSLRELIHSDRNVCWHWLSLVWSASLFLIIVQLWWNAFGVLSGTAVPKRRPASPLPELLLLDSRTAPRLYSASVVRAVPASSSRAASRCS